MTKSSWRAVTSGVPRGRYWGQYCLTVIFSELDDGTECTLSSFALGGVAATPAGWATILGTSMGWRSGLTGTPGSSTEGNAKLCTWGQITPSTSAGWGRPAGKRLCRGGAGDSGGQAEREPATCPCGKGSQQHPGLR